MEVPDTDEAELPDKRADAENAEDADASDADDGGRGDQAATLLRTTVDSLKRAHFAVLAVAGALILLAFSPNDADRFERVATSLRTIQRLRLDSARVALLRTNQGEYERRLSAERAAVDTVFAHLESLGYVPSTDRAPKSVPNSFLDPEPVASFGRDGFGGYEGWSVSMDWLLDQMDGSTGAAGPPVETVLDLLDDLLSRHRAIDPIAIRDLERLFPRRCTACTPALTAFRNENLKARADWWRSVDGRRTQQFYREQRLSDSATLVGDSLNTAAMKIIWPGWLGTVGVRDDFAEDPLYDAIDSVKPLPQSLSGLSIRDALSESRSTALRQRKELSLMGLAVDDRLAAIGGPALLIVLLIYCIALLQHTGRFALDSPEVLIRYPWPPLFAGRPGTVAACVTLVGVPAFAVAVLARRTLASGHSAWPTLLAIATIALSMQAAFYTFALRIELGIDARGRRLSDLRSGMPARLGAIYIYQQRAWTAFVRWRSERRIRRESQAISRLPAPVGEEGKQSEGVPSFRSDHDTTDQ